MKRIILTATSVLALGAGAALADGSVTVYTATPQNFIDALVPAFEAKTNRVEAPDEYSFSGSGVDSEDEETGGTTTTTGGRQESK